MITFVPFTHRDANFRINADALIPAQQAIIEQRQRLEDYLEDAPTFKSTLKPVAPLPANAPDVAQRMARAAAAVRHVGPMAAVAGTMAQLAVEAALAEGIDEAIVENGGDIYTAMKRDIRIALFTGISSPLHSRMALLIRAEKQPLAICSSSARMGHSISFGQCDLATIIAPDASLADAAATHACNRVKHAHDIPAVLNEISSIHGISGVILVKDQQVGIQGNDMPEIIKNSDPQSFGKITIDATG